MVEAGADRPAVAPRRETGLADIVAGSPADAAALAGRVVASTGDAPDGAGAASLHQFGFTDPKATWPLLRACRDAIGAESAKVPLARLLTTLAALPEPGQTLLRFVRIIAAAPPPRPFWTADGGALERALRLFALAPGLAEVVLGRPALFRHLLSDALPPVGGERADLRASLAAVLAADAGDAIAACRRWLNDAWLALGAEILAGARDAAETGPAYSGLAACVIEAVLEVVQRRFREAHGEVAGARFAVFALGKLGGREMTAGSDLDLVLVYDPPDLLEASNGPRPLAAAVYFRRLCNAVLAALTERQGAETLYEIDVRLSPWARKAAAATSFESFRRYYAESAWTWELMALTRGRAIAGEATLMAALDASARDFLVQPRENERLRRDVDAMRQRIARHRKAEAPWDIKRRPGGLVDIEFIAQYLMLREARRAPEVIAANTVEALAGLAAAGALTAAEASLLSAADRLWLRLSCLLRLTAGSTSDEATRRRLVAGIAGLRPAELEHEIATTSRRVRALYDRLIAAPAGA